MSILSKQKPIAVVTGSSGFIGTHLVSHLRENGYEVREFDVNSYNQRGERDIRRFGYLLNYIMEDANVVFHLAGIADIVPSIEKPLDYFTTNVMGTVNVLEAARKAGVKKFVYAASSSCYGDKPYIPTDELEGINPKYPYAMSKHMGRMAVDHYHDVYGMDTVSLCLFNVYGRGQHKNCYGAVFSVFMAQLANGKPLTVVGDGSQQRDFIHVNDVCEAFRIVGESKLNGIYNIGAGHPQTVLYLANLLGGNVIHIPKRPGEPDCTWADITKFQEATGWEPKVSFESGVADMVKHLDDWKDGIVWTPESIEKETKPWMDALQ